MPSNLLLKITFDVKGLSKPITQRFVHNTLTLKTKTNKNTAL